ncbi:19455_t:CDS:1, partial [Funneliformis geosporum]
GIKCPLLAGTEFSAKVTVPVPDVDDTSMAVAIIDVPQNVFIACAWSGPSSPLS